MKTVIAAGRFPNKRHTSGAALVRALLDSAYRQHGEILVPAVTDEVRVAYHRAVMDADPGARLEGNAWTLSNGSTLALRAVRREEEVRHA